MLICKVGTETNTQNNGRRVINEVFVGTGWAHFGHGMGTEENTQNFMSIGHFCLSDAKVTLTD